MNTLGERIRHLRKVHHVTQEALSKKTTISRSNISKIESNDICPTTNAVVSISNYFNVSTDWLLLGSEEKYYLQNRSLNEKNPLKAVDLEARSMDNEKTEILEMISKLENNRLKIVLDFMKYEMFMQISESQKQIRPQD